MTRINILPPLVADMIAAGEVVERPASVIKELMENSFDAGASKVTVEFKSGGATYIKISDDGCGMSPEDAGIAFTRHATSKLHDEKGLEAIGTMGFRGEALAAIAAVSRIELITREKGAAEGVRVVVQAGDIIDMSPIGCPEGTSITVRDIFHNTPARLKFLKSDRSEASACISAALHCALGRPEVSVRLKRDGEEVFFTPGDGREESAVYALLGRETARGMLPVSGKGESMAVTGFTSSPAFGRGNRANQHFYCNGRYIKSVLLQSAVEQAYKNTLLTGKFPSCVLYLELSRGAVDVNVHPAKTEVKFSHERAVFDAVYYGARAALEAERAPAAAVPKQSVPKPEPASAPAPKADSFLPAAPSRSAAPAAPAFSGARTYAPAAPAEEALSFRSPTASAFAAPRVMPPPVFPAPARTAPAAQPVPKPAVQPVQTALEPESTEPETPSPLARAVPPETPPARLIGEAMHTYILVEKGDTLILIDKHAAHERINFDRLRQNPADIPSQTLLEPLPFTPDASDAEVLQQHGDTLAELGFTLEPFGRSDYILRGVPAQIDAGDALPALEEICAQLRHGAHTDAQAVRDEVLKTVACKAAIKAGWQTEPEELLRLADAVCAGEVKYCPHGRPVAVTLTRRELDKLFKRIV